MPRYLNELEEDRLDGEAVRAALDEVAREGTVPWDEVKQELGYFTKCMKIA